MPEPSGSLERSVLDRLIDQDPRKRRHLEESYGAPLWEIKQSLLRDLEWLLNTRRSIDPVPESCPEVRRSAFWFGLPDITSLSGDSGFVRSVVAREMEDCIRLFEPRLMQVRVVPASGAGDDERDIHFQVEALLRVDPSPERVVFDTRIETGTGRFLVSGEADA